MNNKLRKVLKRIEENGFEAYIVGGYVRDHILGIESTDIDICTNALPKDIIKIFKVTGKSEYGSFTIKIGKYNIDITTYRSESNYVNRKPQTVEYIDNLITDIKRRDFTINSLCMNSSGQIIDLLDGRKDIEKRIIRVIGDLEQKLTEDPLRILRAVRFSIILDFALDEKIIIFIKKNKNLIKTLSYTKIKAELDRIFSSKRVKEGLKVLKDLDLLGVLGINYQDIKIVPDILGIWAQIEFDKNYPFTKNNLQCINKIRAIIKNKELKSRILFENDLYVLMVAGEILDYQRTEITRMYSSLPIKSIKNLKITTDDIIKLLNINPSSKIKQIYDDLIDKILSNEIKNNYTSLKKYLLNKWK
ncbi:MAG: hypothetical protein GX265_02290 [Mollicutes bacterium]|nr:hypothetical protein [Mollicutes bacterium]